MAAFPNLYDVGDDVRVTGRFTDLDGDYVDPASVFCSFKDPGEDVTDEEYSQDGAVTRESIGVYHLVIDAKGPGIWYYRWSSTGTGKAAGEGSFRVIDSNF